MLNWPISTKLRELTRKRFHRNRTKRSWEQRSKKQFSRARTILAASPVPIPEPPKAKSLHKLSPPSKRSPSLRKKNQSPQKSPSPGSTAKMNCSPSDSKSKRARSRPLIPISKSRDFSKESSKESLA